MKLKLSGIKRILLLIILIVTYTLQLKAQQSEKLSLAGSPSDLPGFFSFVQEKYGFRFFYNNDVIKPETRVSLSSEQMTIQEIIKELSAKTGLSFRVMDN